MSGAHTINVLSALPTITGAVIINGATEPDYGSTPIIEVNGAGAGAVNGLVLGAGSGGSTIRGLVIQNFNQNGILVQSANNVIAGNYIGLDADGTTVAGNNTSGTGIQGGIRIESANNTIGRLTASDRNVISGNTFSGIALAGAGATGNQVLGNYIGTDACGTLDRGNTQEGIEIDNAAGNTIGGSVAGARNVISGNDSDGIEIDNGDNNIIQGNYIGTDYTGTLDLGNSRDGIDINEDTGDGSTGNLIGGTGANEGNLIFGNDIHGIEVRDNPSVNNTILGNRIYGNAFRGINLEGGTENGFGITANDLGDGDAGANDLQNFPVLGTVDVESPTQVTIDGTLNSAASSTFRIEFYKSTVSTGADPSGHGEGETYLGFTTVTTDGSGNASFSVTLTAAVSAGEFVTATATEDLGGGNYGSTSEFALNATAASVNDPPVNSVPGAQNTNEDTALVFSSGNGNLISISDVDVGGSPVQVTLTGTNGRITLSGTTGLTFSVGDGTADTTMTFTGTVTNINTALAGMSFSPTPNFNGAANLQIVTNDQGNTGSGGAQSDTDNVAITVNAVNDAPVAVNQGLSFDGVDDKVVVAPAASLSVTTAVTMEAWVQRQGVPSGTQIIVNKEGEYELGISSAGNIQWALANTTPGWNWVNTGYTLPVNQWTHIAVSYNAGVVNTYVNGSLVHSYSGSGSIGDVYPALNELTIGGRQNASDQRFQGLIDEVRVWNVARTGVEIATNYNSTLTGDEPGLVGYWRFDEAIGTTALDLTANANHGILGDGVAAEEPTRQFTYTLVEDGSLSVPASGVLTNATDAEGSPLTAVLVTGPANAASFTLNPDGSFSYTPVANFSGTDSFVFLASDGSALSQPATVALTVTPVNDAPVNTVPGAQTVNEDTPLNLGGISVTDVDGNLSTVQLGVLNGTVTVTLQGGATISAGANGTNTLTLSGTQADINATLATLVYQGTLDYTGPDTLTVTSTDTNTASDVDTVAITVDPVNDAPVLAANTGSTVTRGGIDTMTTAELQVTDVDNSTAQLTYTVTVGPVNGQLELTTFPGLAIVTFTQAQIDAGQVVYVHDGSFTTGDSFTFTVSDGAGGTVGATVFGITVTPVNSVPTLAVNNGSTVVQGLTDIITAGELQVVDLDHPPDQVTYTITSGPSNGQLELTTAPGIAITTFTQADIDAGRLVFVHSGAAATSDGFTFTVSDSAGGTIGATTFTFTVDPFIPPPGGGGGSGGSGGSGTGGSGGTGSGSSSGPGSGGSGGVLPPPIQPPPVLIGVEVPVKEVSVAGATQDPLPRAGLANRAFARIEQPSVGIDEPPVRPAEVLSLPVKKMLAVGHKLVERLTRLADDLERGMEEREQQTQLIGRVASFSGMALSAGFVAWILRGGALVASFLVSMPAWRHFDPLPVLGMGEGDRRKRDRKARQEDEQESKQFRGLGRVLKSSDYGSSNKKRRV